MVPVTKKCFQWPLLRVCGSESILSLFVTDHYTKVSILARMILALFCILFCYLAINVQSTGIKRVVDNTDFQSKTDFRAIFKATKKKKKKKKKKKMSEFIEVMIFNKRLVIKMKKRTESFSSKALSFYFDIDL